ncbi:hypothetical protein [Achromobacter denitrificans]|uniref:hypothetical protein n=1 Tax=Achromobacter denitrificans TaxID=32002 RepID=UPI003CFBE0C9
MDKIYLRDVWVASAGRCEFFIKNGCGQFDQAGNFVFEGPGGWIGYAQDNNAHPAFA